jgi:hypothetical protein
MSAGPAGHPTTDELVLHYYGEAEDGAALERHLAGCAACRQAFADLQRMMAAVVEEAPPERGPDYEARLWRRLEPRLRPSAWRRRTLVSGALAASLVAAFLLGRHLPRPGVDPGASGRERILLVAVGDHLDRSQVVLLELLNADPRAALDVGAEQRTAEDLVSANRLYRQAAVRSGEAGMAHVLEELERVLVEVANGPSELEPADLAALRRRIGEEGVLFRVHVIGAQIREREREAAGHKVEL